MYSKIDCHVLHLSGEGLSRLFCSEHAIIVKDRQHINQRCFYNSALFKTFSSTFSTKNNLITNGNGDKLFFSFSSTNNTACVKFVLYKGVCFRVRPHVILISPFVRPPAFVRFTIVICVSRDWLKTTSEAFLTGSQSLIV